MKKKHNYYIPDSLYNQLQIFAESRYTSVNQIVIEAIEEYLKNHTQK